MLNSMMPVTSGESSGFNDDFLYNVFYDAGQGALMPFVNGSTSFTVRGNYTVWYCRKYKKITSPANNGFYIYIYDENMNQLQYIELGTISNLSLPTNAVWITISRINQTAVTVSNVTFVE